MHSFSIAAVSTFALFSRVNRTVETLDGTELSRYSANNSPMYEQNRHALTVEISGCNTIRHQHSIQIGYVYSADAA